MSQKKGEENKGSNPNTEKGDSKPDKTNIPVIPVNQGDKEGGHKPPTSKHDKKTKNQTTSDSPKIPGNKWSISDKIQFWSAVGSFILIGFTLWAIVISQKALNITKDSFKVQNRPFIQVEDFVIDSVEVSKRMVIRYKVRNLGAYPAKLTTGKFSIRFIPADSIKEKPEIFKDAWPEQMLNVYSGGSQATPVNITRNIILSADEYAVFMSMKYFIRFEGKINYENQAENETKDYTFRVILFPPKGTEYITTYSENSK